MIEAVAITGIVCGTALVGLRWTFADRAAARVKKEALPLEELERKVADLSVKVQAIGMRGMTK